MRIYFGNWKVARWLIWPALFLAVVNISLAVWTRAPILVFAAALATAGWLASMLRLSVLSTGRELVGWLPRRGVCLDDVREFEVVDPGSPAACIVARLDRRTELVVVAPCPWFVNARKHEHQMFQTVERLELRRDKLRKEHHDGSRRAR